MKPQSIQQIIGTAKQQIESGRAAEAIKLLAQATEREPQNAALRYFLGHALLLSGHPDPAIEQVKMAQDLAPENPISGDFLARVYRQMGRYEEERDLLTDHIERFPEHVEGLRAMVRLLEEFGETEQAVALCRRVLAVNPRETSCMLAMSRMRALSTDDLEWMEKAAAADSPSVASFAYMSCGNVLHQDGQVEKAFDYFTKGQAERRKLSNLGIEQRIEGVFDVINAFSEQAIEQSPSGYGGERSILVAGMPRSGTTLLEQMLACYPNIDAGGERSDVARNIRQNLPALKPANELVRLIAAQQPDTWRKIGQSIEADVSRAANDEHRLVDKMPFNFSILGFALLAMPDVVAVWSRRSSEATLWSCWRSAFSLPNLSYTLEELGQLDGLCRGLMTFWMKRFPDRITVVDYEQLVTEPEDTMTPLLARMGLPFDPACLDFHQRVEHVQTTSLHQVRQPLYKSSLDIPDAIRQRLTPALEASAEVQKKLAAAY
ncbi:MAG: sulfotransferase [Lysobacteraceae bacterium]|nr:MAG: sulfotransferase [Xanthomonadaceae bacterium]